MELLHSGVAYISGYQWAMADFKSVHVENHIRHGIRSNVRERAQAESVWIFGSQAWSYTYRYSSLKDMQMQYIAINLDSTNPNPKPLRSSPVPQLIKKERKRRLKSSRPDQCMVPTPTEHNVHHSSQSQRIQHRRYKTAEAER